MNLGRALRVSGVCLGISVLVTSATGATWAVTSARTSAMSPADVVTPAGGSRSLVVQSTATTGIATTSSTTVTALGLSIEALCAPNSQSSLYFNDRGTVSTTYLVSATTFVNGTNPQGLLVFRPTAASPVLNQPLVTQSTGFRYQQVAAAHSSSEVVLRSGSLIGTLLVQRGAHTATVAVSAVQLATACSVTAQVTVGS